MLKFLSFMLIFFSCVCAVFEFYDSAIAFTIPLCFCVFLLVVYLLRFNLKRLSCFRPHNDYLEKHAHDLESPHSPRSADQSIKSTSDTMSLMSSDKQQQAFNESGIRLAYEDISNNNNNTIASLQNHLAQQQQKNLEQEKLDSQVNTAPTSPVQSRVNNNNNNSSDNYDASPSTTSILDAPASPASSFASPLPSNGKKQRRVVINSGPNTPKFGQVLRKHSSIMLKSFAYDHGYHEKAEPFHASETATYLHSKFEHPVFRVISVVSFSIILVLTFISMTVIQFVMMGNATGIVFLLMLSSVCFVLFKRYERDTANTLFAFFLLFITLIGAIFIMGNIQMQRTAQKKHSIINFALNKTTNPYDICRNKWENFTIVDYAFFSYLAYEQEPWFSIDLQTWFPECADCRIIAKENNTVVFSDLYVPHKNLSIITVRGTESLIDVVQDFDLWKEVGLLQMASYIGPFLNVWPEELSSSIIYYVSALEKIAMDSDLEQQRYYYQVLDEYVRQAKQSRKVILVGHSMGGGIGKIVGAKEGVHSISFAAPGNVLSRKKFGIHMSEINRVSVSVKPSVDVVSRIDVDGGLVQHLDCKFNFMACHSLTNTIKELVTSCGDPLQRWVVD